MRPTSRTRHRRNERGQAIILFVGLFSVILVISAIVVDVGLWLAERRSAQRVADLAAAAGAVDLPANDTDAMDNAAKWIVANGHSGGIEITLLCANTISAPGLCTNANVPGTGPSPCVEGTGCDTIRVVVNVPAPRLFTALPFIHVDAFDIQAGAAAGVTFGGTGGPGGAPGGPDQTVILLDASVRMRARELGIKSVRQGSSDKLGDYLKLLKKLQMEDGQVCCAGDDLPDLPILLRCGFAVAPVDAVPAVKRVADYVTQRPAGGGAVAELIELVLRKQNRWPRPLKANHAMNA